MTFLDFYVTIHWEKDELQYPFKVFHHPLNLYTVVLLTVHFEILLEEKMIPQH